MDNGVLRSQRARGRFFRPSSSWLNKNNPRNLAYSAEAAAKAGLRVAPFAMVQMNRMERKNEKWLYVGKCPLPSTGPGASSRKMRPRSEKDPCSENQIRFKQNRFRFRQDVWLDRPLCRRGVMRIYQTSLQSYRLEFSANPSSGRQHSGLQLARCVGQNRNRGSRTE